MEPMQLSIWVSIFIRITPLEVAEHFMVFFHGWDDFFKKKYYHYSQFSKIDCIEYSEKTSAASEFNSSLRSLICCPYVTIIA